jgi:membrane-bound lytic murein transglycosylase A
VPGRAKSPAGIPGWAAEDHAAAFAVWHLTAPDTASVPDARRFFETAFDAEPRPCHCTGYYEPELSGRLTPDARFRHPLYALPPDLPPNRPWFSRAEIAEGDLLAGRELVWLDSAIEGFLAQVQGSVRVRVDNGTVLRLGYAGKNGHPYRSIGQELIRRGEVGQNAMSAEAIRDWCAAHPDRVADLLATNPSFVFFRPLDLPETHGPIGASGVPLTPLRSLAADPDHIAPGTPVWVECGSQHALFIAQDTGSAIKGPGRIDLFCGSGAAAGRMASGLNAQGTIHVLHPRAAG